MNNNFRNLLVWQKAMDLVVTVYKLIELLPIGEQFALSAQMRRAVVSIPSNIAEGHKRNSDRIFKHFLSIANGSCAEPETQIRIGIRLGYYTEQQAEHVLEQCNEVMRMLHGLMNKLSAKTECYRKER